MKARSYQSAKQGYSKRISFVLHLIHSRKGNILSAHSGSVCLVVPGFSARDIYTLPTVYLQLLTIRIFNP